MSLFINIYPAPPRLSATELQIGRRFSSEVGFENYRYNGSSLGNLTGIFLLSPNSLAHFNLLDLSNSIFGTSDQINASFQDDFISFNGPKLQPGTYSLRVTDDLGRSSEVSGALEILDNSIAAFHGLGSEADEVMGSDEFHYSYSDVNIKYGGVELKTFDLSEAKNKICLRTISDPGEYLNNIGSSTFRLVWTGDSSINYGTVTVNDTSAYLGAPSCWTGEFMPIPTGTYGKYSISFVSGNYSPDAGASFMVGFFALTKRA